MLSLVAALVLLAPEVPPECQAPPARDVTPLSGFAQRSGSLSVGLDSVATWCFDPAGTWTGGHKPVKGKLPAALEPTGDCAKSIRSCEAAQAALPEDARQLLADTLAELEKPFLGVKYKPKRSGLAERPSEAVQCTARDRSTLFGQAQARMDLARLASQAQSEYANYRTWLFSEGLRCAQAVARGEKDVTRRGINVDRPIEGGGTQQVPGSKPPDGGPGAVAAVGAGAPTSAAAAGGATAASGTTGGGTEGVARTGGASAATGGTTAAGGTTVSAAAGGSTTGGVPAGPAPSGVSTSGSSTTGGARPAGAVAGGAPAGGASAGGASAGGASAGGISAGGASAAGASAGGALAGAASAGGAPAGTASAGGAPAGTASAGGASAGGASAGGASAGGASAAGTSAGGASAGGTSAGGTSAGSATAGGATAGGTATPGTTAGATSGQGGVRALPGVPVPSGASRAIAGAGATADAGASAAAAPVRVGGPTEARANALASSLLDKWRYFAAERARLERDPDWAEGFLLSRELRECRCARFAPADLVRRLETKDRLPALEAEDEKLTRCEVCLEDAFPPWKTRVQKQCALLLELSEFEIGALEASDDGNGLPPRCIAAARQKRSGAAAPAAATKPTVTAGPGASKGAFIIAKDAPPTAAPDFVHPKDYAPMLEREAGRVYVRVFTSAACVAEVLPGPIQARNGDLLPIPPASKEVVVRGPCGGLAELYFGKEEKPRVSETFSKTQPLKLQFAK